MANANEALERIEKILFQSGKMNKEALDLLVQKHYNLPYPPDHYYMAVPDRETLRTSDLDRRSMAPDATWINEDTVFGYLEQLEAFRDDAEGLPDYWDIHKLGLGLGYGEAEGLAYYAIIRQARPDLVVEFGAGVSTYYANEAVKANGEGRIVCVEPYPAATFPRFCEQNDITLVRETVQTLDFETILSQITERSVVFIDTTHVVKPGSEVARFFLELLPRLPAGVLVHFHDIFFPHAIIVTSHVAFEFSSMWNETLALGIYLRENPHWEIVHPGYWLGLHHTQRYRDAFPRLHRTLQLGSAFWMRRKAAS